MAREVEVGSLVIDQFPAFKDDGFNKQDGLTQGGGDFVVTAWLDAVLVGLVVTITEIGTSGEYKVEWTPIDPGLYEIQILINLNKDIWKAQYESVVAGGSVDAKLDAIQAQVDKLDKAPTLGPNAVVTGSYMDRSMNKDSGKTYNQATDSQEAIRDREG